MHHQAQVDPFSAREADYPSRIRPLTEGDFTGTSTYKATLTYDQDYPPTWQF